MTQSRFLSKNLSYNPSQYQLRSFKVDKDDLMHQRSLMVFIYYQTRYFISKFQTMQGVLEFPRGNIYMIVCNEGNQALRIATNNHEEYEKARVVGTQPNQHDLGQLWMIEKIGENDDDFEIVNCQSNFVWDEEWSEVKLRYGKQSGDQLYKVEKAGSHFFFKTSSQGDRAVCLEGVLRYKAFDPNSLNQLFSIVPVDTCSGLNNTCIIVNKNSGKALDIPGGTHKHGERLVQWAKNKRFNQRWRWEHQGSGYLLVSVLTGHCVDIAGESTDLYATVCQWDRTGASNQQWRPSQCGPDTYRIESCHAHGQGLGIQDHSIDDGGKLEINKDGPSTEWQIIGYVPQ